MTDNEGDSPTTIDLFCGAGGFSLGIAEAGFDVQWAIDSNADAIETFSTNHDCEGTVGDIQEVDGDDLSCGDIDLIIGSPPCPTHSHIGRNRLDGEMTSDDRHSLYEEFIRFIDSVRPTAFLMENVPGMTHSKTEGGVPVITDIQNRCEDLGYHTTVEQLDAADYGVPQHRNRLFIIGANDGELPRLSALETHREPHDDGERGADIIRDDESEGSMIGDGGTGKIRQQTLSPDTGKREDGDFVLPGQEEPLRPWNTISDALLDLPSATAEDEHVEYEIDPVTPYQRWIRGDNGPTVGSHTLRNTSERDRMLYSLLGAGVGYSIEQLPDSLCPHTTDAFKDKYRKLNPTRPSQTVIAHLSKAGHRFIHPRIPRSITVREAARLQSFPDNFTFPVSRTYAYQQVGNAVPPLVAYALGTALLDSVFA